MRAADNMGFGFLISCLSNIDDSPREGYPERHWNFEEIVELLGVSTYIFDGEGLLIVRYW